MQSKSYQTPSGVIRYYITETIQPERHTLVFLPGLTADHRLFERQVEAFSENCNVLVWDAPGHGESQPFALDFDLFQKARWLREILQQEGIRRPVLVGQSMGGYVAQAFVELYPEEPAGFLAIDSAPLGRRYVTAIEIWLLKRMEPVYRWYPWKLLLQSGTNGVAQTPYGRSLMREMMLTYDGHQDWYAKLCGHGYRMLAEAMEADLPYAIPCPAMLICGEKDHAGSCVRYNKAWHSRTGIPLHWIPNAGHNSNTDAPETVNRLIWEMLAQLEA